MTNKVKLLTAFFVLSFAMMMGVTPFNIGGAGVLKAEAADTGAFTVTTNEAETSYDYDSSTKMLTISGSGEYTISMDAEAEATDDVIKVTSSSATITLKNVNISSISNSPIEIASTAGNVTIKLEGENTLTATGDAHTGLAISTTNEVTITSDVYGDSYAGSLTVSDDNETTSDGVAIGSENNEVNIKITGGIITAEADGDGYGVGIGSYTGDANITITGGIIKAEADGDDYGVAIGSYNGNANITITGGTVTAESDGDNYGTGIGSYNGIATIIIEGGTVTVDADGRTIGLGMGSYLSNVNITITGGTVTVDSNGNANAAIAIGCGVGSVNAAITGGEITAKADGTWVVGIGNLYGNGTINISGGTISVEVMSGLTTYVVGDKLYILPDEDTGLVVNYSKTGEEKALYSEQTNIGNLVSGTSFYCQVQEVYSISDNVSVEYDTENSCYNVIVSVFGGGDDDARYLKSVKVFVRDTDNKIVSGSEQNLTDYKEYGDDNDKIVFSANISTDAGNEVCALIETFNNRDSENVAGNTIYYLNKELKSEGGAA